VPIDAVGIGAGMDDVGHRTRHKVVHPLAHLLWDFTRLVSCPLLPVNFGSCSGREASISRCRSDKNTTGSTIMTVSLKSKGAKSPYTITAVPFLYTKQWLHFRDDAQNTLENLNHP